MVATAQPLELAQNCPTNQFHLVLGNNWLEVPGLGALSVYVNKNGDTSDITIYNAKVKSKETFTNQVNGRKLNHVNLRLTTDARLSLSDSPNEYGEY